MNCKRIKTQLSYYIDDECAQEVKDVISRHIHECDRCVRELKSLELIKATLKELPVVEPSADYFSSFNNKLSAISGNKKVVYPLFRIRLLHYAVAAMILLVAGLFLFNRTSYTRHCPEITYVKGKVVISQPNAPLRVAFVHKCLKAGQTIATSSYAKIDFELFDRCKIALKENTKLHIEQMYEENQQFIMACKLEEGTILADVAKRKKSSNFQIITDSVKVSVIGTKFMVEAVPGQTGENVSVAVLDGKVKVCQEIVKNEINQTEQYIIEENQKMIFLSDGTTKLQNGLSDDDFRKLYDVYNIGRRDLEIKSHSPSTKSLPFRSDSMNK